MMKHAEVKKYAEARHNEMTCDELKHDVEVKFFDAYMEIRWAIVERKGEFIFVFAEHYPPIYQHIDETEWYKEKKPNGEIVKEAELGLVG